MGGGLGGVWGGGWGGVRVGLGLRACDSARAHVGASERQRNHLGGGWKGGGDIKQEEKMGAHPASLGSVTPFKSGDTATFWSQAVWRLRRVLSQNKCGDTF